MATKKVKGKQAGKLTVEAYAFGLNDYVWRAIYRGKVVAKSEEGYRTEKLALAAWDRFFDMVTKGNVYLTLPE